MSSEADNCGRLRVLSLKSSSGKHHSGMMQVQFSLLGVGRHDLWKFIPALTEQTNIIAAPQKDAFSWISDRSHLTAPLACLLVLSPDDHSSCLVSNSDGNIVHWKNGFRWTENSARKWWCRYNPKTTEKSQRSHYGISQLSKHPWMNPIRPHRLLGIQLQQHISDKKYLFKLIYSGGELENRKSSVF